MAREALFFPYLFLPSIKFPFPNPPNVQVHLGPRIGTGHYLGILKETKVTTERSQQYYCFICTIRRKVISWVPRMGRSYLEIPDAMFFLKP